MVRVTKNFLTPKGMASYVFDFIPAEPTLEQLNACVPHTCDNCEWRNLRHTSCCRAPDLAEGEYCTAWQIGAWGMVRAEQEYYARLHGGSYGNTGVSL